VGVTVLAQSVPFQVLLVLRQVVDLQVLPHAVLPLGEEAALRRLTFSWLTEHITFIMM
jgi:hypothetical protein